MHLMFGDLMAKKQATAKTGAKTGGTGSAEKKGGADAPAKKVNPALMKPLQPFKELAAVVASDPLPRPQIVKQLWEYIKKNDLQNPENRREIRNDVKLRPIFGKDKVKMYEVNQSVARP